MDKKRLFISIPVDNFIIKKISKKIYNLNLPWDRIKTTKIENIHITIKFLGDTSIESIPIIIDSLKQATDNSKSFVLEVDKTDIFNENNPRTLVLKFKESKELNQLFNNIEEELFNNGIANKENRKFKPHITIARVKQHSEFKEFKDYINWEIQGDSEVPYIELVESELTKEGPKYTVLQTFDL